MATPEEQKAITEPLQIPRTPEGGPIIPRPQGYTGPLVDDKEMALVTERVNAYRKELGLEPRGAAAGGPPYSGGTVMPNTSTQTKNLADFYKQNISPGGMVDTVKSGVKSVLDGARNIDSGLRFMPTLTNTLRSMGNQSVGAPAQINNTPPAVPAQKAVPAKVPGAPKVPSLAGTVAAPAVAAKPTAPKPQGPVSRAAAAAESPWNVETIKGLTRQTVYNQPGAVEAGLVMGPGGYYYQKGAGVTPGTPGEIAGVQRDGLVYGRASGPQAYGNYNPDTGMVEFDTPMGDWRNEPGILERESGKLAERGMMEAGSMEREAMQQAGATSRQAMSDSAAMARHTTPGAMQPYQWKTVERIDPDTGEKIKDQVLVNTAVEVALSEEDRVKRETQERLNREHAKEMEEIRLALKAGKPPNRNSWLTVMKTANPNATDAELLELYNSKFGRK